MENLLQYSHPADCFEEALPIGNGSIGAMVYGKYDCEKISLNHDTLWSGKPRKITRPNAANAFHKSRELVLQDEVKKADELLVKEFTADFTQNFLPLGNLFITCKNIGKVDNYLRKLDMQKGIVQVSYLQDGIAFKREYFVSHPDNCIVINISSDKPSDYEISFDSQLKSKTLTKENRIFLLGECPDEIKSSFETNEYEAIYNGKGIKFVAGADIKTNGVIKPNKSSIAVTNATSITIIICIETSFLSFDKLPTKQYFEPCKRHIKSVSTNQYSNIKNAHIEDFSSFYNRIVTDFGFQKSEKMTDERIQNQDKSSDLGIIELLYNFGRYLIISSSRAGSQATNLQGIWNETLFAPWRSNYTVNINTEMNYWPVLMTGLYEFNQPIIDLAKKISVTGKNTAKNFYNAKGYCSHHNVDLWGHSTPVGAQLPECIIWVFWNMSSGWLCRHLWEHYEYTQDIYFLKETAYPLMKGAAEFYLDLLIEENGKYILTPTTSPENSYIHKIYGEISLAKTATMTQAILIDLFTNLSKTAEILNLNDDFIQNIREKLPLLDTYTIGSEGQLLEYGEEFKECDIHHRHLSHLYGLYPGESITTLTTPKLAEACRVSLERRGDISTGWAMGWRVCLWAKLKNGNRTLKLIENQLQYVAPPGKDINSCSGGTYPNLFDAHPPFQIDGNFGVCAGITLMFLQCENEKIHILPALPSEFKNGYINGLKAKGNITVDIVWENGKLKSFSLLSPKNCTTKVITPDFETEVNLKSQEKFIFTV